MCGTIWNLSANLGCPFPPPFLPFSLQKWRGAVPRGWEQQPAGCQRSNRASQRTEGRNRDGRSFLPYRSEFLQPSAVKDGGMNSEYSFWAGAALQGMSSKHPFGVQEGAVRSELSIRLCLGCQRSIFLFPGGTWAYCMIFLLLPAGACEINVVDFLQCFCRDGSCASMEWCWARGETESLRR